MTTNTSNPTCPSVEELHRQLEQLDEEIAGHVATCRRCQALLRLLAEEGAEIRRLPDLTDAPATEAPPTADDRHEIVAAEGAVIVASSADETGELLVAVVLDTESEAAGTDGVIVAPISANTRFAGDWDIILEPDETPLGYPLIVEVWNHGTVLREQIEEQRGFIVGDAWHRVSALFATAYAGDEEAGGVEGRRGLPIVDDADPRLVFQDEEAERARAFFLPALRLIDDGDEDDNGAEEPLTVGAILAAWLDEQGYDTDDYARAIGFDRRQVEAVCANRIDPLVLTADRLADVFVRPVRDLPDLDEEDLDAALSRAIADDDWSHLPAHGTTTVRARTAGLRGADREAAVMRGRGASSPLTPEEQAQRKRAYLADFRTALEEKTRR